VRRVLYINQAGNRGGAETVLLDILKHLDRTRFEPLVVSLQDGPFVDELNEQAGAEALVIETGRFRNPLHGWRVVSKLRSLIRTRGVDLVHSNGTGAHLYGGLAARLCGVPNVYHQHDLIDWSWSMQGLIHLAAVSIPAAATVAVSEYSARAFKNNWHSDRATDIIYNAASPAELPDFDESPPSGCEDWVAANLPIVVWCGRLQRWKGAHIFLEAAALVKRQVPEARFLVVGGALFGLDSEYEHHLRGLAKTLELNDCLRFTGYATDVRPYLSVAEFVVHSSIKPEPFGLVILESMSLGTPVVAAAEGGPAEIVEHEATGLLVPPRDPHLLASAMVRLIGDDRLREAMGVAARKRAREVFSMPRMLQKIESVYCRLIDSVTPASRGLASKSGRLNIAVKDSRR
jgi:glycosyltransferase involved in cell wall biosynthesis